MAIWQSKKTRGINYTIPQYPNPVLIPSLYQVGIPNEFNILTKSQQPFPDGMFAGATFSAFQAPLYNVKTSGTQSVIGKRSSIGQVLLPGTNRIFGGAPPQQISDT